MFTALERARREAEAVVVVDGFMEAVVEVGWNMGKLSPGSAKLISGRDICKGYG